MPERPTEPPKTTMHVRSALDGDLSSLSWVVERLAPLLLEHANYRLGPTLRTYVDARDLVNEAWLILLPRLGDLVERDGRMTPVLLRFLTTTVTNRVGQILRDRCRNRVRAPSDRIDDLPADDSEVDAGIHRSEMHRVVTELLATLSVSDREIIILRGMEQSPAKDIARVLGVTANVVDQRYSRALKRLRSSVPSSVFDELVNE